MILEYSVNEAQVQPAWLKTLYDLVEELNCKCRTYIDESYNRSFKQFTRTRTIEVYGSETMLSWLKLRMERYSHFINEFNEQSRNSVQHEKRRTRHNLVLFAFEFSIHQLVQQLLRGNIRVHCLINR